jgi:hypothetical protein
MAIKMIITEDNPKRVVLEMNPKYKKERDNIFSSNLKGKIKWLGVYVVLLIFILYNFLTKPLFSHSLYFWAFTIVFFIALIFFVISVITLISKNAVQEIMITIDTVSQKAIRAEKSKAGKVRQTNINLNEVSRVLIHNEVRNQSCLLVLELQDNKYFEIDTVATSESNLLLGSGKQLGELLNKPVILKTTEFGNVLSEQEF